MRVTMIPIVVSALGSVYEGLEKSVGELETRGKIETDHSIVKIDKNTEKSPGDLRRLTFT